MRCCARWSSRLNCEPPDSAAPSCGAGDHTTAPKRHRPIRSFVLRQGRQTEAQKRAFDLHWPALGIDFTGAPVDFDRVLAIKEAIAAGKYPVDADKIADRMIALDLGK